MKLRTMLCALALVLPATAISAQPAMPEMKMMASSADIQALIAKAKAMPAKPLVSQPIVGSGSARANLEYRAALAPASIHDKDAELMYVIDGSGTVTIGGTLVDGTRTNPTNQSGSSIQGGTPSHFAKGDFWMVPAGAAHQIAPDTGAVVVLMSTHIPIPPPAP